VSPVLGMDLDPALPSEQRFDAVFREYRPALLRFLRRRVGNDADAEEIAQEACIRLLRYPDETDPQALKALLYRIAINLVGMRARESRRRFGSAHVSLDELELASGEATQEQVLLDQERLRLLQAAINALPEKCRQVFILSRISGLSYPEIASRCGISVKMVEKHISKALAICRDKVGDRSS
jgi:RNA polymerase sigma factor (sigma-70 family)